MDKVTLTTEFVGKSAGKTGSASRKVSCSFEFRTALCRTRVRAFGRVVKDKNGADLLVPVPLPGVFCYLTVNGEKFPGVSYCKPPDVFDRRRGAALALRYALRQASSLLEKGEHESLVRVCLTKPPKPSSIRHGEKLAKLNAKT